MDTSSTSPTSTAPSSTTPGPSESSSPLRVLVTGAAGFVGSHLVELLSTEPRAIVVATDAGGADRLEELGQLDGVTAELADLRDTDALASLSREADVIVHMAAVRTQASAARPRDAHDVNVGATYDLLTAARDAGVRRFVFGSSHTIYGSFADPNRAPFEEDQPGNYAGINMYAATKLAAEAYLEAFAGAGGPDYVSLRLGTIYGPRTSPGSNGSLMTDLLDAVRKGETPRIPWSASARHGLIHVDDIVEATRRAIFADASRTAINVVGAPLTSEQIYGTLARLAGADPSTIEWNENRTRYQVVSQARMAELLDFRPSVSLEDGLRSVIDWYATVDQPA